MGSPFCAALVLPVWPSGSDVVSVPDTVFQVTEAGLVCCGLLPVWPLGSAALLLSREHV